MPPVASPAPGPAPRVSVVMPAYNAERYAAASVRSILGQTFTDFELIVVDDGSTDGTLGVIGRAAAGDHRVRVTSRPNTGYTVAIMEGVGFARADYIARMDADDVAAPGRFQAQVEYLEAQPDVVAVGTSVRVVDAAGLPIHYSHPPTSHEEIVAYQQRGTGGGLFHPAVMMRRTALAAAGGYRPEYEPSEDADLFFRLAEVGRLGNLPEPLLDYRTHPASASSTRRVQQNLRGYAAVRAMYERRRLDPAGLPPAPDPVAVPPAVPPAEQYEAWARAALADGFARAGRKYALKSCLSGPSVRRAKLLLRSLIGPRPAGAFPSGRAGATP